MRISLDGRKPEGEWCSLNEPCGIGDGKRTKFETPFPAKEARGLHFMRDFIIIGPENVRRVLDPDGELLRDEEDGYTLSTVSPDLPVGIEWKKAPGIGVNISCSSLGRRPEKGEALKVLPLTDSLGRKLDEKLPAEMRKRNRAETARLPAVQDFYREAYEQLVVDCHGFVDDAGNNLAFDEKVKKGIINTLGALLCGGFAWDRASVLQQERQAGRARELSD